MAESERYSPLTQHPFVRTGAYSWAFLGMVATVAVLAMILGKLLLLVVPLLLAVFPAALLAPLNERLKRDGVPAAVAALITLLGTLAVIAALIRLIAPVVAAELPNLGRSLREGVVELRDYLASGPFGLKPVRLDDLIARASDTVGEAFSGGGAAEILAAAAEGVTASLLLLLALFFYLKDGGTIGRWLQSLFPRRWQADAEAIGRLTWATFGSYFRGQILVALVDAVAIGVALAILRVPLALPLAVLVFFGGLFPVVGAFVSGSVAVLVALADRGLVIALVVLGVVVLVQQLEGHVLAPLVLGRATELHPLAVILSLAAGGILLGIFGALIAVPVTASLARGVGYLRSRTPG
jgi:predicted PurR-regulated permease PerM